MKNNNANTILFISHEASRTGAPMLLLYLIQWLKEEKKDWNFDILTLSKGELDPDFAKAARHYDFYFDKHVSTTEYYKQKIFNSNFNAATYCEDRFFVSYSKRKYDVIYANSVASLQTALKVKNRLNFTTKLICNVHELPTVIDLVTPDFIELATGVDLFVAGSNLVAQFLHEKYKISKDRIKVVYDFTNFSNLPEYVEKDNSSTFTVGSMGTIHWRKGHDLFLLTAINLKRKFPAADIKFRWIGSQPHEEKIILENDLLKSGLDKDYIQFLDAKVNYSEFFTEMNVFVLTSREDPFPLVAIEAAAYGLPIITFDKASGINEVISNNSGGFIVPYLDIEEMTDKIMFYYNNREKCRHDGSVNMKNFKDFNVTKTGPEILKIMQNIQSS